jgi:hypothetical protein
MLNINKASAEPYIELVFKPNEQVLLGATEKSGAFKLIPHNIDGIGSAGANSFKALAVDDSTSMNDNRKRRDAVQGTIIALENSITPDDMFAVYAFGSNARRIFPEEGSIGGLFFGRKSKPAAVLGTPENIKLAIAAVKQLEYNSNTGTVMSNLFELVLRDFLTLTDCDEAVLALITDGENDTSDERSLNKVLAKIVEHRTQNKILKVQMIAVGPDPSRDQLAYISDACMSDPYVHVRSGADAKEWENSICKPLDGLSRKKLRQVTITFKTPKTTKLLQFTQTRPIVRKFDLVKDVVSTYSDDGDTYTIQTGAWEDGERLFRFVFGGQKPKFSDSAELAELIVSYKIGRKELALEGEPIRARWSNVSGLSTRMSSEEVEALGLQGVIDLISQGLQLMDKGDVAGAQVCWQKAYDKTREANVPEFIPVLKDYMDINEATGIVTARQLSREDSLRFFAESSKRGT